MKLVASKPAGLPVMHAIAQAISQTLLEFKAPEQPGFGRWSAAYLASRRTFRGFPCVAE